MRRYQTQIEIPPDRYVGLQLPSYLPQGRAIITVQVEEPDPTETASWPEIDPDHQDIEWWDEFNDPETDDTFDLQSPSSLL